MQKRTGRAGVCFRTTPKPLGLQLMAENFHGCALNSTAAILTGQSAVQWVVVPPPRARESDRGTDWRETVAAQDLGGAGAGVFLPTSGERRAASWAGWFMAITFFTSIPALLLYDPVLDDTKYILGAGHDTRIELAAFLEVLQMIAQIGVAVVMFPILKRQSERLALGYVASRTMESAMIGVGLIAMLSILTLRGDLAASVGANGESLEIAGRTLVSIHDWTFLMGPGFCVGVNDLLLGYLMYTTGLMPRRLALVGLIGGPLLFVSRILVVFGVFDVYSSGAGVFAIPVFVFEASFAIYLIVRGFRASPVLTGEPATT